MRQYLRHAKKEKKELKKDILSRPFKRTRKKKSNTLVFIKFFLKYNFNNFFWFRWNNQIWLEKGSRRVGPLCQARCFRFAEPALLRSTELALLLGPSC